MIGPSRADNPLGRTSFASAPGMSIYERTVRVAHRAYKLTLSPWIGRHCRFLPTCSDYAAEAQAVP